MHHWLVAPSRSVQKSALEALAGGALLVDAHRNLRGPYTAAGEVILAFVLRYGAAAQEAAAPRLTTLLAVRPELGELLEVPAEVEASLAFSREGNLTSWSLRSAQAIVDFLLACLDRAGAEATVIALLDLDKADPLDREWLALLLRRADPERLTLLIGTATEAVPEPLAEALRRHAALQRIEGGATSPPTADAYIACDCVDDDPAAITAYRALPAAARASLHRDRAEGLEARGETSLALGAIPMHREAIGEDAAPLAAAARRCMHFAFYDAALDWAERAVRLAERLGDRAAAYRDMIFASLLLGRHEEVEALCDRCLAEGNDAELQAHATYALAILNARLKSKALHDYPRARGYLERSLAFTASLPPSEARTANLAFLRNTLALVEMREGKPAAALVLMDEAIALLEREAPARFAREAMILFYNRARLHVAAGREADALGDHARLLELEPGNAEALFSRGRLHQRAGRAAEAIRDYDAACFWAPPQEETLLHRAETLAETGQSEAALRDYARVLVLDPASVDALVGRARLRWQLAEMADAESDVRHGLALRPGDARLHCIAGLIALSRRLPDEAEAAFCQAIICDPGLADAWANRATVLWRRGDLGGALADLDAALALRDDPAIRRNRQKVADAIARRALSSPLSSPSQGVGVGPASTS